MSGHGADNVSDGQFIGLIVIGLLSLLAVCLFDVAAAYEREAARIDVHGPTAHEQCGLASDGAELQRRIDEARKSLR